jgi:hypothetical protein
MTKDDVNWDPMNKYDVYWNPKKPDVTLYVRHGHGLADLADAGEWSLDSTVSASEVPADLAQRIDTDGHAFRTQIGE